MKVIEPKVEIYDKIGGDILIREIEECGRVCYKSENRITSFSAEKFVKDIIAKGHESVLEHTGFRVKFTCDRGVTHEIVRHRLASYSQESTRYCNYSKDKFGHEITVIKPLFFDDNLGKYTLWYNACENAEKYYFDLLKAGAKPEEARSVLPNSLKTEIVMTANVREWRHFLKLRTSKAAHPQMRQVAMMLLGQLYANVNVLFDDIWLGTKEE